MPGFDNKTRLNSVEGIPVMDPTLAETEAIRAAGLTFGYRSLEKNVTAYNRKITHWDYELYLSREGLFARRAAVTVSNTKLSSCGRPSRSRFSRCRS